MTGASVNFKAVKSAGHAVSHASREVSPTYLLPIDKSMGTVVVLDDAGNVSKVLEAKMALASPRAKVDQRYSPVWEGILNLRRPEPGEDAEEYRAECSAVVTDWYKQYEASTGHKVLRVDVHLDEGHMVDGEAVLNAHAHVIADRTNDLGRVIKLSPKQLRELQTMTAEVTSLERGKSSFETGRKHISHHAYKHLAERGRLETQQVKVSLDREIKLTTHNIKEARTAKAQVLDLKAKLDGEPSRLAAALKAQEAALNEKYRLDRERMKQENADALAAGLAKMYSQKDYSELKKAHEAALAEAAKVPALEAKVTHQAAAFEKLKADAMAVITPLRTEVKTMKTQITELTEENAKLAADKAKFAVMAEVYQAEKAKGTPAHLIEPTPKPAKTAIEAPKTPVHPIAPPAPEKSLKEALTATLKEFYQGWLEFIKHKGFTHAEVDLSNGQYRGTILDKDDLFAVQKTGRHTCVIHLLSDLDMNPNLDNPDILIRYRDGVGQVIGQQPEQSKHPSPGVGR